MLAVVLGVVAAVAAFMKAAFLTSSVPLLTLAAELTLLLAAFGLARLAERWLAPWNGGA